MSKISATIKVKETDGTIHVVPLYNSTSDISNRYECRYNGSTVYAEYTTDANNSRKTGFRYKTTSGEVRYLCGDIALSGAGTVIIQGNLTVSGTLNIAGDLQVSGDVSGGTINVTGAANISGSTSGTVNESATISSSDADISCNSSNITFGGDVSYSSSKISTAATVTNNGETTIYCDTDINTSSSYGINNYSKLTVEGALNVVTTDSTYGVYNRSSGEIIVNGTLTAEGGSNGVYTSGTITVNGILNANGGTHGVHNDYSTITVNGTLNANGGSGDGINSYANNKNIYIVSSTGKVNATGYDGINYGTWTIDGTITATTTSSSIGRGVNYGIYEINGTLYAYASSASNAYRGTETLSGTGKAYANDTLYWQNGSYV